MYDKTPYIAVSPSDRDCHSGWGDIAQTLRAAVGERQTVCVECYPGVKIQEVREHLEAILQPARLISTEGLLLPAATLNRRLAPLLTDDPVFGVMNAIEIKDYFDPENLAAAQHEA